jgi:hypothetical protein
VDLDSLHEELNDACLLGGEELVPERIEPLQRLAYLGFRNVAPSLPCRPPGPHDDFGCSQQSAQLINDGPFDLGRCRQLGVAIERKLK